MNENNNMNSNSDSFYSSTSSEDIKTKIRETSGKILRISKVLHILSIIGLVMCIIGAVTCTVLRYNPILSNYVSNHPDVLQQISETDDDLHLFVSVSHPVETMDNLNTVLNKAIENCFEGIVTLVLVLILLKYITKLFHKIVESDSPFQTRFLNDIKNIFIVIGILCFSSSIPLGIIMIFVLICLYYIFKYGCELQKESDETL